MHFLCTSNPQWVVRSCCHQKVLGLEELENTGEFSFQEKLTFGVEHEMAIFLQSACSAFVGSNWELGKH